MIALGKIVRLQVQTSSLKVGTGANQRYDRRPIESLPYLELNDGGVTGIGRFGQRLADIHHRDHPESKHRGDNGISIGFTGHYVAMRERFGLHLVEGAAAENILIEHDGLMSETELANGLYIETMDGRTAHLDAVIVAEPCAPYTRWAMQFPDDQRPDRTVTEALQFLGNGMRGFYCQYSGPPLRIALDAQAYLPR